MFHSGYVIEWSADGRARITKTLTNNKFFLNTNRMFELTDAFDGHTNLLFFDNLNNSRDGGRRMKVWGDRSNIITSADTDLSGTNVITLNVFPKNDPSNTAVATTYNKSEIAYVYPKGHQITADYCWVGIADAGWDFNEVLVDHDMGTIEPLLGMPV